jgi:Ribonuclease G/E
MNTRRIFLDRGIGEARGVVMLDDRPERFLIERDTDERRLALGARSAARVTSLEPALATAFLDLGDGAEAILPFRSDAAPVRGALIEVEIRAEPRRGKLAIARPLGPAEGVPRLIAAAPDLAAQLCGFARGVELIEGRLAREAADEAEAEAVEVLHALPGGGVIAVEPTRALTAIDIDLGERKGVDAKRVTRQANIAALGAAARLLRLKGLGGIVVIDLVGRGHDGVALMAAARTAFAPDNPGVAIGPIGRFGTMELSLPRRRRPVSEVLCREDGALSDETLALRLTRSLQTEGAAQPGARLEAACVPAVANLAAPLIDELASQLGARFTLRPAPELPRHRMEVSWR